MNDVERFDLYAADFEIAFENDDWSVVARHFAVLRAKTFWIPSVATATPRK